VTGEPITEIIGYDANEDPIQHGDIVFHHEEKWTGVADKIQDTKSIVVEWRLTSDVEEVPIEYIVETKHLVVLKRTSWS
jgi:hypothetical protein